MKGAKMLEWTRRTYYGGDNPVVPEHWTCPEWRIELKENERGECAWMNGKYELTTDSIRCDNYECGSSTYVGCFDTADEAKALAQRLQDVLDGRDAVSEAVERIVSVCEEEIREANVNYEEDNFDAGVVFMAQEILALLRSRDWSKGEDE